MTRIIYLIRHAETANKQPLQTDLERDLTQNGIRHAQMAGAFLKNQNIIFDRLLCSPAIRTLTTAQIIANSMSDVSTEIIIDPVLYDAIDTDLLDILLKTPNSKKSVALVGHNPTISEFAKILTKSNVDYFTPCTIAAFQFDIDKWSDLRPHDGRLLFIHFPSIF